jgi:protein gp37
MSKTSIEWTATYLPDGTVLPGYTFNPWQGCFKISPACEHCYAETQANRFNPGLWGRTAGRKGQSVEYWEKPRKWNKQAQRSGIRRKVFCASMADVFEMHADTDTNELLNQWRSDLWSLIIDTPHLDWLLLTKRPENVLSMVPADWLIGCKGFPQNVWIGTTVENQKYANERIPELLKIPAPVRFLSVEPMMGPVDFGNIYGRSDSVEVWGKSGLKGIHWVIAGGESGHAARPSHPDWFRSLRDQCAAAGVPFFFKQWGEWIEDKSGTQINSGTNNMPCMVRVGKKAAGRLLDRREHNDMPT